LVLIPRLNFLVQVEAEAELLAAWHRRNVGLVWWNMCGTQFLRDCSTRGIPRQKQRRQVVEEQNKDEDGNHAE